DSIAGSPAAWDDSRHNGVFGWVAAFVLVALALVLLTRRLRLPASANSLDQEELGDTLWLVILGLASTVLLFALVGLLVDIVLPWPTIGPAKALSSFASDLVQPQVPPWTVVGTVVAAAAVGLALAYRRRFGTAAVFLLAFAVWCLPRAFTTVWRLERSDSLPFHSTALLTLDTAVTAAVAVLVVLYWTGRRQIGLVAPLVALVLFTLIAHPGTLLPAGWKSGILFYLALIYPVSRHFLFGASTLNTHLTERPARVLGAIGLSALLLVVAAMNIGVKSTGPGIEGELSVFLADVGRYFLMVPLGALLVAEVVLRPRPR
ncbi:MAG: hypothetical protein ACRDQZ_23355, partial [Mycobacteriales bacterium]